MENPKRVEGLALKKTARAHWIKCAVAGVVTTASVILAANNTEYQVSSSNQRVRDPVSKEWYTKEIRDGGERPTDKGWIALAVGAGAGLAALYQLTAARHYSSAGNNRLQTAASDEARIKMYEEGRVRTQEDLDIRLAAMGAGATRMPVRGVDYD